MQQSEFDGSNKELEARLNYFITAKREIQKLIQTKKLNPTASNLRLILKLNYLAGPQMYGPRLTDLVIQKTGLMSVSSKKDRGDAINRYDAHFEIKSSYKSNVSGTYNFLQFRTWQALNGYCLMAIDIDDDFKHHLFFLTPNQLAYEIRKLGGLCHGSKSSTAENKTKEYRLSLNEAAFRSWKRNYSVDSFAELQRVVSRERV